MSTRGFFGAINHKYQCPNLNEAKKSVRENIRFAKIALNPAKNGPIKGTHPSKRNPIPPINNTNTKGTTNILEIMAIGVMILK